MNPNFREAIYHSAEAMTAACRENHVLSPINGRRLPDRARIIAIVDQLRALLFPGYFGDECAGGGLSDYAIGDRLTRLLDQMRPQIRDALRFDTAEPETVDRRADEICLSLIHALPDIQQALAKDVQAAFDGDPAAKSREDIVFSYPGLYAIFVYRVAHVLVGLNVPYIPRIMTEHAHSLTGIDINAGAMIGEYFFIDHGTGVVIGETTVIGDRVKLYQGVTLGALSTRMGQQLQGVKRHPTIGNRVTIYAGATILGGETLIGDDSVIGGNCFVTHSIPAGMRVSIKSPELTLRDARGERPRVWEKTDE